MSDAKAQKASHREKENPGILFEHEAKPLYKGMKKADDLTFFEWLLQKEEVDKEHQSSKQGVTIGRKQQPFNMRAVVDFQDVNPHHTRCLMAKVAATVGLGFRREDEIPRNLPLGASDTLAPKDEQDDRVEFENRTEETTDSEGKTTKKVITSQRGKVPESEEDKKKKIAKLGPAQPTQKPVDPATDTKPGDPNDPGTGAEALLLTPTAALIDRQKPAKCDTILDPLCEISFQDLLNDVAEDYWQCGAGAIEVVREAQKKGKVTGLHHIPIADLHIFMEDEQYNHHYEIESGEGTGFTRRFARWGEREELLHRATKGGAFMGTATATNISTTTPVETISEVIYFRRPSSKNRWYGYPDWLSAVTSVELIKALTQFKYDFFNNRGVPEFMLFLIGKKLSGPEWAKIEASLRANIGQGNSHKSVALNIEASKEEFHVQLEKLAMEGVGEDDFVKTKENLALDIVTAHGVPPLLAGIQIPGKLGANNELPNALMAFHVLVIGPAQRLFRRILSNTLGSPEAGLGLTPDDFALRTIPEEIDVGTLETISRMRQDLRGARAEGRDMSAGVKE